MDDFGKRFYDSDYCSFYPDEDEKRDSEDADDSDASFDVDYDSDDSYDNISEEMVDSIDSGDDCEPKTFADEMAELFVGTLFAGASVVSATITKTVASGLEHIAKLEEIEREEKFAVIQKRKERRYRHRHIIRLVWATVAALLVFGIASFEVQKLSPIGYSPEDLVGLQYEETAALLKKSGFNWIVEKNIDDLCYAERHTENTTTFVKVGFWTDFDATTRCPTNLPVVILYHTVQKSNMPFSSREAKSMNYKTVVHELEKDGFGDIECISHSLRTIDLFTKEGDIASISVGGKTRFSEGDLFRVDETIVIEYFTKG